MQIYSFRSPQAKSDREKEERRRSARAAVPVDARDTPPQAAAGGAPDQVRPLSPPLAWEAGLFLLLFPREPRRCSAWPAGEEKEATAPSRPCSDPQSRSSRTRGRSGTASRRSAGPTWWTQLYSSPQRRRRRAGVGPRWRRRSQVSPVARRPPPLLRPAPGGPPRQLRQSRLQRRRRRLVQAQQQERPTRPARRGRRGPTALLWHKD